MSVIDRIETEVNKHLDKAETLRQSILKKAFFGVAGAASSRFWGDGEPNPERLHDRIRVVVYHGQQDAGGPEGAIDDIYITRSEGAQALDTNTSIIYVSR